MTTKSIALVLILVTLFTTAFGQDETTREKTTDHYFGLQVNQLIRQIFNFNDNNFIASNPYFLSYSANSRSSGSGVNVGLGYTFVDSSIDDPNLNRDVTSSGLSLRLGYEKKKEIFARVIASLGIDLTASRSKQNSLTKDASQFGVSIGSESNGHSFGAGPRATINYSITSRMLIGTEVTYYFSSSQNKTTNTQTFTETEIDPATGQQRQVLRTQFDKNENSSKSFSFQAPSIIYLILKF